MLDKGLRSKLDANDKIMRKLTIRVPVKDGEIFVSANPRSPAANGLQADLNAAANIGLRAILDPDWCGKWWYVPARLDDGWRIPDPKSCGGAACLKGWKVAKSKSGYSTNGTPKAKVDSEAVESAYQLQIQATAAYEEAKNARMKTKRGSPESRNAKMCEDVAKQAYSLARQAYKSATKDAKAAKIVNLWRDIASTNNAVLFADGSSWREYAAYRLDVEKSVVEELTRQAKKKGILPG